MKCEIRIYDKDFNWLNAVVLAESVQFTRELYGVGTFQIQINPDKQGATELLRRGNIITLNGDGNKAGIVRDFDVSENKAGAVLNVYGETSQGLTKQRITVPPTAAQDSNALGWDKINAPAETVIKHYAQRNLINAFDSKRNVKNMIMRPDLKRGMVFPWKSRYQKLSEELYNIGAYSEMGYAVFADVVNKQWIFDVIQGFDRTQSGQKNPSELTRDPVLFKMDYHNLSFYKYSENYSNYRSTPYCGGQGEDENRLIYTLNADVSGYERFEEFIDCGQAENINELIYYGEQKLNGFKEVKSVEADTLPRAYVFEKDYFLGDKVTMFINRLGIELDTRITSVKEIWEPSANKETRSYRSEIRFGGNLPNIFTVINKQGEVR